MKKVNIKSVEDVLMSLSKLSSKCPTDDKGNMDVEAFNKMSEVMAVKNVLEAMGVPNQSWLSKNGFFAAAMILRF